MLQNVHYFDQISNVRYANKVCFFRTYKTPQTLEITRIAGLLFKSTLFFAYTKICILKCQSKTLVLMPFLVLTPAAYLDKPAYMVKICLTYSVLYGKVNRFFGYFPNKMLFLLFCC